MAAHKTNRLLKWGVPILVIVIVLSMVKMTLRHHHSNQVVSPLKSTQAKNTASHDSAAESLDTLTAQLSATEQKLKDLMATGQTVQQQNQQLLQQLQGANEQTTAQLSQQIEQIKTQLRNNSTTTATDQPPDAAKPITRVSELSDEWSDPLIKTTTTPQKSATRTATSPYELSKPIPYYTIPANATSVKDRLMSPLIGRIPIKGVVTDPYPFKIVLADDTLAANGLRVPNLRQMIVSGYAEGDLNLVSTRGWVTSLTFVFADGTISTTTSNDNNIGHFTKENALGYLSDELGNPAIRGKLITNAPTYLGINAVLGAADGAANAYATAQTTTSSNFIGNNSSSVTGSQSGYLMGQAMSHSANSAQQWWHDRVENSFDAVFVSTIKLNGEPQRIVVNFTKEIAIDYNPNGRKINYAHSLSTYTIDLD